MSDRLERLENNKLWSESNGNKFYTVDQDDYEWLIKQVKIQEETELTWSYIENGEIEIEPDDFYSVYQDIAMKHYED